MAFFGLPGTDPVNSGEFLGRIQFDARSGFWTLVRRTQGSDGRWEDDKGDPFQKPVFAIDFPSIEIGWIKFASPPAFVLAPFGGAVPPCPDEMSLNATTGKQQKAFKPGFRVKCFAPRLYGSTDPFYFAHTAAAVMQPMDELHQLYLAAPEAKRGMIPVVAVTGNKRNETTTSFGTNTNYSPIFAIQQWIPRPRELGEVPVAGQATAAPARQAAPVAGNGQRPPQAAARPAPVAPAADDWGTPAETGVAMPAAARQAGDRGSGPQYDPSLEDSIPF